MMRRPDAPHFTARPFALAALSTLLVATIAYCGVTLAG